ncbi:extracellular solute-binding protein [Salinadaptatus halalkaliphilus]|uniref:Extracellular solute-binding protein n=1 Tax=Salinadaptatus halalkaliphilus TaxID=2419781 RepID=A0A4S3TK06_9EURY|nr:extracellular solute-binding protein [Salinadaptatus halalkaliphilus]
MTDFSGDQWEAYWEEDLIPSFEEQTEVEINLEYAGFQGTGEQRLATLLQSGEPPEFYHATTSEFGDLINQGLTRQVDDIVDDLEAEWGDALYKYTLQPMTGDRDDETHSIPHGVYVGGCFNYRSDVYEALDLEVPETWEELVENARIIDESDEFEEMRGFGLPAVPQGKSASDFANWLYNSGGDVWQENGGEIELWFDEEHVMPILDTLQELAQYSPDPSSVDWGSTIEYWIAGRFGQCFMNNAWLCGPSFFAGAEEVALNTDQALIPTREGADPVTRGWVLVNGTPIIDGSSNPDTAGEFKRYMYGPERHVEVSLIEPMRFIPPYEEIIETDAYQNAEIFQVADGAFLEKNQFIMDEIVPELDSPELPSTPETLQVGTFDIPGELTNRVIVDEQDPEDAYEWAVNEYEQRYQDAQDDANY